MSKRPGKHRSFRRLDQSRSIGSSSRRSLSPAEVLVISFLLLIVVGTFALKLLPGLYRAQPLSWSDATFTSTSAVCVTGLIVEDTATFFTFRGQVVVLLLVQVGGLGMLVLASVVITALGGRPSMRAEMLAASNRHVIPHVTARQLIRDVVQFTLVFEFIGALMLYSIWGPRLGWREALWPSIFHSISAFCNAGFSTNTYSLIDFQDSPATLLVISGLIVTGGLGFVTLEELRNFSRSRNLSNWRLSVHSKLVLTSSAVLIVFPWVLFALFEWEGVLKEMSPMNKLSNAFFMSITPRTAGFNSIDYAQASDSSNFLTIILMMIGGSPGSTAGGLKTTTVALLFLLAWSRLRSQETVTFADRSIPDETIQRAAGLFVITTTVGVVGTMLFAATADMLHNSHSFIARLFEVVSALNTVGLSMGITASLTEPTRWLLIVLMFLGRTGPLAIAAALIVRLSQRAKYRLAYEDVVVG